MDGTPLIGWKYHVTYPLTHPHHTLDRDQSRPWYTIRSSLLRSRTLVEPNQTRSDVNSASNNNHWKARQSYQ